MSLIIHKKCISVGVSTHRVTNVFFFLLQKSCILSYNQNNHFVGSLGQYESTDTNTNCFDSYVVDIVLCFFLPHARFFFTPLRGVKKNPVCFHYLQLCYLEAAFLLLSCAPTYPLCVHLKACFYDR